MTTLAYIIPTIGRTTLARAVDGVIAQMQEGDELFVVGDGERPAARAIMADRLGADVLYLEVPFAGDWGSTPIDEGTRYATADFLCYLGDDDEIWPGAMDVIREAVSSMPPQPHIFAMISEGQRRAWSIRHGEVSGQQLVMPNDPKLLPRWAGLEGSGANDSNFLHYAIAAWGAHMLHTEVIARAERPGRGEYR